MADTERGTTRIRRSLAAPGVIIPVSGFTAGVLHYTGGALVGTTGLLWLLLALGIGFALPRWWTFLLAALPWPVSVGLGLMIERQLYLGDLWQLAPLFSVLIGLIGIGYGWLARRGLDRRRK